MARGARRRGGRRLGRIDASLAVLLTALAFGGCAMGEHAASLRLRDEIARIRSAGEPMTFGELRGDQPSGDADAAPDYRAAAVLVADVDSQELFDLRKAYQAGASSCPPVPPRPELRERARRLLSQAQPALDSIDRAARKPICYLPFNLENGELPPFAPFRTAGALLSLRTLELSIAGRADDAAASLVSSLRMLRVFDTEPMAIAYLVRLVVWVQASEGLPVVLSAGPLSEASLGDLDEALAHAEAPDYLKRTFEGERVFDMWYAAMSLGPDWPDEALRPAHAERPPFWKRARLLREAGDHLAARAALVRAAEEPWPQVLEAIPAASPGSPEPPSFWDVAMERTCQNLAATRAGRVGVAIERYRRRQGRLPTSLDELGSPRPVDPSTGRDLTYSRAQDGYVASSIDSCARTSDHVSWPAGVRVCLTAFDR